MMYRLDDDGCRVNTTASSICCPVLFFFVGNIPVLVALRMGKVCEKVPVPPMNRIFKGGVITVILNPFLSGLCFSLLPSETHQKAATMQSVPFSLSE